MDEKKISLTVIKRLPKYYSFLGELLDMDIVRISSKKMSEKLKLNASQIRQDLNNFGSFGLQGYGYDVESLYREIGRILGLDKKYSMILIGAGNIGQALLNYEDFAKRGFAFKQIFDNSPAKIGTTIKGIPVTNINKMSDYLEENKTDIAVLTVPKVYSEQAIKILNDKNIRGIWNFTNKDIHYDGDVKVEDVHLMDSLMTLSYKINEKEIIERYREKQ
ncbi:MAG: redox-sensing transcriptional repressor Rex [Lachnospirales bacterium]